MINFSLSTLISTIFFSNIMLVLLYIIFRNTKLMIRVGLTLLPVYLIITTLRLMLPFEFGFTKTIKFSEGISKLFVYIKRPLIDTSYLKLTLWEMFLMIWFIGFLVGLYKLYRTYHLFNKKIVCSAMNVSLEYPYKANMDDVCVHNNKKNCFNILKSSNISTPMIFGIRKPYILIPDTLALDEHEIYYILKHEASHFFHYDLL